MARAETHHTKFPAAAPRPAGGAVRVGFVPLIDAAPLIAARELGLFEAHGVRVALERQIGWGNVRDKLAYGHLDAAHALIGMPLSSALAADWSGERLVSVMELGAGGNAITLGKAMVDRGVRSAASLAKWVADHKLSPVRRAGPGSAVVADDANPDDGKPVLAHVFGCSMHHYLLRDWLASAGIDPDLDVRLCVLPPEQMPTHLRNGHLDGFCVGEPWNTTAERGGGGTVVAPTTDLLPDHPEKVLAVARRWATDNRPTVVAMIKALLAACAWCADDVNHPALAKMLSAEKYLGLPVEAVMTSLRLDRSIGVAANQSSPRPAGWRMRSFAVERTFPSGTHAAWLAEQMIRWGHADADADVVAAAGACTDASFYRQAAAETGVACPAEDFPMMPLRHHGCYDARRSPYRGPSSHISASEPASEPSARELSHSF